MDINLTDSVPIQRKYTAIPRPLYAEDGGSVESRVDSSKSAAYSSVLCVRKKDGTLRLCIDYRLYTI